MVHQHPGDQESAAVPRHGSYVFLLDEEQHIHPLPHGVYVALVRGEAAAPEFAGRTMRVADWYVRLVNDEPVEVINETYGTIVFDAAGRATTHDVAGTLCLPAEDERDVMRALLFGSNPGGKPDSFSG